MTDPADAARAATLQAIAALEAQRAALGDAVTEAALAPLRERLAQLAPSPAPGTAGPEAARLRQVTVLFLDIVGSTALAERLDPETLHEAFDGLLAEATALVGHHGGTVLQYAGDSVLATFGDRVDAGEDSAERAVRCTLALRDAGHHFGERMRQRHGAEAAGVRLGLHTGRVLLGAGVDAAHSIRGFAVHIAARMEQSAPRGSIRISRDTWLLVRHAFDTEAQAPLAVKGSREPLPTWLVHAERTPDGLAPRGGLHGADGPVAPLVGRDAELRRLDTLLAEALVRRRPCAVLLEGEPGVGKSRLLAAWRDDLLAAGHRVLVARTQAARRRQPFALLRELVLRALGVADSDSAAAAAQRLVAAFAPGAPAGSAAEADAHAAGRLLGLPFDGSPHLHGLDGTPLRRRGEAGLRRWLHAIRPPAQALVLLLEDLHWADDDSVAVLRTLAGEAAAGPLVLVASARPEWRRDHDPGFVLLALAELAEADRARLADALLASLTAGQVAPPTGQPIDPLEPAGGAGDARALDPLRRLLVERSDGNPFFMEELLRMLLDHGVLQPDGGGGFRLHAERLAAAQLPTTLVEVLQARLDALHDGERRALRQASIVGPVFWAGALAAMDEAAPAALPALQRRGLVDPRESSAFADTPEAAFHHQVLQQVAYDGVLRAARRQGHAAVAQWLAERAGERRGEHLVITALHFERAGEPAAAIDWYRRAARAAYERAAFRAGLELIEHAQGLLATDDPALQWTLHLDRSRLADPLGLRDVQEASLAEAQRLAGRLADPARRAQTMFERALLASRRGHEAEALVLARQAAELAGHGVDPVTHAQCLAQTAWSLYARGELPEALVQAHAAVDAATAAVRTVGGLDAERALGKVHVVRATLLKTVGRFAAAREDLAAALPLAERTGLRRLQVSVLESVAGIDVDSGRNEAALAGFERARAAAEALGDRMLHVGSAYNVAFLHWLLGRRAEAAEGVARLLVEVREIDADEFLGRTCTLAGALALEDGRPAEALAHLAEATTVLTAADSPALLALAQAWQVRAQLAAGDGAAAAAVADVLWQSLAAGLSCVSADLPVLPALACHEAFVQLGDARADAALVAAHATLQSVVDACSDASLRPLLREATPANRAVVRAWAARAGTDS